MADAARADQVEALRAEMAREIAARWGSVHRFVRDTGLTRSTVYQVLGGRYAGNMDRQLARLRAALAGPNKFELAAAAIKAEACKRCVVRNSWSCRRCAEMFADQARAALAALGME